MYQQKVYKHEPGGFTSEIDTPETRRMRTLLETVSDYYYKEEAKEIVERCLSQYPFSVEIDRVNKVSLMQDPVRHKNWQNNTET